jgi:hypothetical protein
MELQMAAAMPVAVQVSVRPVRPVKAIVLLYWVSAAPVVRAVAFAVRTAPMSVV